MNNLKKESDLYNRKKSEIIKFAKAGRSTEDYAVYLSTCYNVIYEDALGAVSKYENDQEIEEPLKSIIYEDARFEYYIYGF